MAGLRLIVLVAAVAVAGRAHAGCHPFAGEWLRFALNWEIFNAGYATMAVSENKNGYRTAIEARSNAFIDLIKKVRDRIVSEGVCVDGRMQSERLLVRQREGKYRADKTTIFRWREGVVLYGKNGKLKRFSVPKGHLNVVDAFYIVRRLSLQKGDVVRVPIFDSGKRYEVEVYVLGHSYKYMPKTHERVRCIVIEPKLKTEGIFSSIGTMKIWLTDDARRIPVMMTAKIKIGHIVAHLVDWRL